MDDLHHFSIKFWTNFWIKIIANSIKIWIRLKCRKKSFFFRSSFGKTVKNFFWKYRGFNQKQIRHRNHIHIQNPQNFLLFCYKEPDTFSSPTPREGILGPCPPQITACAPQTRNVPIKWGLCPKEITASVPLECISGPEPTPNTNLHPRIRGQEPFFADFKTKTFFWSLPQNLWILAHMSEWRPFFGPHSRICEFLLRFRDEDLFFCPHHRFREFSRRFRKEVLFFGLHFWIWGNMVFVPSQKLLMPPPRPPRSHYAGTGPAFLYLQSNVVYKLQIHMFTWRERNLRRLFSTAFDHKSEGTY